MSVDPLIGSKISNFRIERLIGRGGMARVYYAWDERLQRPVALKVIDERYRGDPAYTERFIHEASYVATWRHPNILQVYFAGEEDGLYYYVMEYIPGRDLGQILAELKSAGKLLPASEVLRIASAVTDALDYAHQRKVIHRDVKPSNVIVADDGRIVLADFGLAMNASVGTVGSAFGSPLYIAPEQARNSSLAVPQSDMYSVGVMLFEMLTGSLPFDDPNPTTLIYQHISQQPPSPHSINPALGLAVETVLNRALAKNPQNRFPSGRYLATALAYALDEGLSDTQAGTVLPQKTSPVPPPPAFRLDQAQPFVPVSPTGGPFATAATLPPPVAQTPPRSPAALLWAAGCAGLLVVLFLIGILLVYGATKLPGLLAGSAAPQATATGRATAPALVPNQGSLPSSHAPTPTEPAAATATATPSPSPTETLTPTLTETPILQSVLFFVPKKTSALVVENKTGAALALRDLGLRGGSAAIQGDAWNAITLNPGECVLVVSDPHDVDRAGKLPCTAAAAPLRWTGDHAFWTSQFDIFYLGQRVGTCTHLPDRSNGCTSNFRAPTPTPTPTETPTSTPPG
jgi:tRNA A-37 threonylcarbamoyl transferase component Bud32